MRPLRWAPLVLAGAFALGNAAWAHDPPCRHHGEGKHPCIEAAATETLQGVVKEVKAEECKACGYKHVSIALDVAGKERKVALAPQCFLEEQDFALSRGDQVEVTMFQPAGRGPRARGEWLAMSITKGGQKLLLRDEKGPRWDAGPCR